MTTRFRYEARGPSGRSERGALEAPSAAAALAKLRARNLTPLQLKPLAPGAAAARTPLSDAAARDLARTLAQMLRAGLSFAQALKFASEDLSPGAAAAAMRMREAAEHGEPASGALQALDGPQARLLAGVMRAGETSGRLADALEAAAASFARSAELNGRLSSAMIYPSFVIAATLAVLAGFVLWVVPAMAGAFAGAEARLPASTRALLGFSAWLKANGLLLVLALSALIALAAASPSVRRLGVALLDRVLISPLGLGIAARLDYSTFAQLSALSLHAGVPAAQAFESAASAVRSERIRARLAQAIADIRLGERPAHAFARCIAPPKAFLQLMLAGEETGKLAETLKQAGALLATEAEQRLERLGALAGPIVTLVLGAAVASVVTSLFLGLLSMSELAGI